MNRRRFLVSLPAIGLGLSALISKVLNGDRNGPEAVLSKPHPGIRPHRSHNVGMIWSDRTTFVTYDGGLTWEVAPEIEIEMDYA